MMRMVEIRFYAILALIALILKNQYFYIKLYEISIFWNIISIICFLYITILWITSLFDNNDKDNKNQDKDKDK